MLEDLDMAGAAKVTCKADVCIIGAGTAGLFLATLLLERGLEVAIVESGARMSRSPADANIVCEQKGIAYRGAEDGRSFGLGGTSVRWGGQMISMTKADFLPRPHAGIEGWPIDPDELQKHVATVRQYLGMPPDPSVDGNSSRFFDQTYPDLFRFGGNFDLRLSQWLPFGKRNFASLFSGAVANEKRLRVWLNAHVTALSFADAPEGRRVGTVVARGSKGGTLLVQSKSVVLCAGALESTRLLLELDDQSQGMITAGGAPLGRYFADHLSVTVGRLRCHDWPMYNKAVAPIFRNGVMFSPRLELSDIAQRRLGLTSAFAHLTFVTNGESGFDVVRSILRRRQGENHAVAFAPRQAVRMMVDLARMGYWRTAQRRLWIPRGASLMLQVDIEQAANPDSRLQLAESRDAFDRRRLTIDWRITERDRETIRTVTRLVLNEWRRSRLGKIAEIEEIPADQLEALSNYYDVFHPTGSIRMGSRPAESVVDSDLKLWQSSNFYVSSTAVFPSSGSANPGLTHLALTARLADHIVRQHAY